MMAAQANDRRSMLRSLADTLEMWANMLREHCDDPANGLPNPCLIDDWLSDYRDAWVSETARRRKGRTA